MRKAILLSLCIFSSIAFAENWVSVGDGFYIDKDSIKRKGEIAEAAITLNGNFNDRALIYFDCKKKVAYTRASGPINYDQGGPLDNSEKIVCRRVWEVWK